MVWSTETLISQDSSLYLPSFLLFPFDMGLPIWFQCIDTLRARKDLEKCSIFLPLSLCNRQNEMLGGGVPHLSGPPQVGRVGCCGCIPADVWGTSFGELGAEEGVDCKGERGEGPRGS